MKFLISNYSSNESTEPLYLNTALNLIDCQSTLWPDNVSAYDIFDIVKPDIHITHHKKLTIDILLYMKENKGTDLVINITGLKQNELSNLEQIAKEYDVTPLMFFSNQHDHGLKSSKTNITTISHGADVFLGMSDKQFDIDYGIFVNDQDQIYPIGETYHYIANKQELQNIADFYVPINNLSNGYINYKHIIIRYFNNIIPQVFFDAAFYNGSVFFDVKDRTVLNTYLKYVLGDSNYCDINSIETGNVRDKILKKHTCLHKTKSLLSQLPCKEETEKLQQIIESNLK